MPAKPASLDIAFWGVRGSTPTPIASNLGFGGNTSCFQIQSGRDSIIIDAGSGIRELGRTLKGVRDIDIFLTHFHWDHILGIPFFAPLFLPNFTVTFHSFPTPSEIQSRLHVQMSAPFFTLDFDQAAAKREFRDVSQVFSKGALQVTAFPLNHPQGAVGYRVEAGARRIVIATDVEHGNAKLDKTLREYAEGADLLVYDAQYTPEEYEARRGWGHSHYAEAANVARDAGVKQLLLSHHDPTHTDTDMARIEQQARALFENTFAAREHQTISLSLAG